LAAAPLVAASLAATPLAAYRAFDENPLAMSSSERANGGADPILDRNGKGDKTTVRLSTFRARARFAEFSRRRLAEFIANTAAPGQLNDLMKACQGVRLTCRRTM
jgi:hypothetical protein